MVGFPACLLSVRSCNNRLNSPRKVAHRACLQGDSESSLWLSLHYQMSLSGQGPGFSVEQEEWLKNQIVSITVLHISIWQNSDPDLHFTAK